jgi:hypothetical protein
MMMMVMMMMRCAAARWCPNGEREFRKIEKNTCGGTGYCIKHRFVCPWLQA